MVYAALVILLILLLSLETIIRKKFNIERRYVTDTKGKHIDRWGRGVLLLIAISVLGYAIFSHASGMKWYLMGIYVAQFGFQAIMQWMFLKRSKEYVITSVYLALGVLTIYNIDILFRDLM
ncbi:DUF4181 domain-containing protein [Pontibacillus sp. ALD_SL1]|uniref:DUF4181 domain-containing protein n=1 Tax=Pontibacillus sp. ALD_SL1 TaxID=2777185 RepID=UPI001A97CA6C|nr:DUF4181 domain-containing protein [Pontibacillus sp. ALD_SL1]QSS98863.1 DUF4181 domain-containing protein [Pontibacillus sp. ALD_SL1]